MERGGLTEALKGDPVILLDGGHTHAGTEAAALDLASLEAQVAELGAEGDGLCRGGTLCHPKPRA